MATIHAARCWVCGQYVPARPEREPLDHAEPCEEHVCPTGGD